MGFKMLKWMPPAVSEFIYTVLLKPKPLRKIAQAIIKTMIPPQMEMQGVTLFLNQDDPVLCGALTLGCYEQFELKIFQSLLRPGMCVLDLGANIGLYSMVAAKAVGPEGRVVAVEPDERNCRFVEKTAKYNGFQNLTLVCKAVSDKTGGGKLYLCGDNKADHRIYDNNNLREAVEIELTSVDDLRKEKGIVKVDVMKMDIQGAEAMALRGMKTVLKANHDIRIIMELWPWGISQTGGQALDVLHEIRDLGFNIFEIDGNKRAMTLVTDDRSLASLDKERQHANLLLQRGEHVPVVD